MRGILQTSAPLWGVRAKSRPTPTDPRFMELFIPTNFVIGLIVISACLSVLRCLANDIQHAHEVNDLTNEVIYKRDRYLAELSGETETGEVIILDEDNR